MIMTGHNVLLYGLLGVVAFLGTVGISVSVANAEEAPTAYTIDKADNDFINRFQDLNLGLIRNTTTGKMTIIGKTTKEQVCSVVYEFPQVKVTTISIVHGGTPTARFRCF